jgi:arylformamidase
MLWMHTYDVTLTISPDLPIWPGDSPFLLERVETIDSGANANVSVVKMGVHTGTHVDAPDHFLNDGVTVDQLPIDVLVGRAYVLSLPDVDLIDAAILEQSDIPPRTRRILFKTRNSDLWADGELKFQENFVALSEDGAKFLVDRNVKLIGVDYLSVAPFGHSRPTHEILLKAGVVVIEGLNLAGVSQGRYTLHCLPLKIAGAEGAPARAILVGV